MKRLFLLLLMISTPVAQSFPSDIPFLPGEKISFTVNWTKIKAAELTLEVAPMATIEGEQCWHFVMAGKTSGFVNVFYKVKDRIDAYTDLGITRSVFYEKKTRGSKQKDERIEFDWEQKKARYIKNGTEDRVVKILPGTFDPLSVFYVFRLKELKPGQIVKVPVSDGKKCVIGQGKVLGRQPIRLGTTTYECVLVIPDLKHIGGVFRHGRDATMKMWFTADPSHIPVKVETKVKVGTFHLELRSLRKGRLPMKRLRAVNLIR